MTSNKNLNNSNFAVLGLILSLIGQIGYILPVIGVPILVAGLILSILGLKSPKRSVARTSIILCLFPLSLFLIGTISENYMESTGYTSW